MPRGLNGGDRARRFLELLTDPGHRDLVAAKMRPPARGSGTGETPVDSSLRSETARDVGETSRAGISDPSLWKGPALRSSTAVRKRPTS